MLYVLEDGILDLDKVDGTAIVFAKRCVSLQSNLVVGWQHFIDFGRKVILVINTGAWFNRFQFQQQSLFHLMLFILQKLLIECLRSQTFMDIDQMEL
jgi:hypothetical protein